MDTSRYIQSCNPARFIVTFSLLIFSILFALQLDGIIKINYWLIFLPLFIWKMLVVFGACTGVFCWCKNGERNRIIRAPDNDCRALIIYFFLHIFILIFEILTCDKLENKLETRWIVCCIPLYLCTFLTFLSCLWSLKVQRNFLIQAFISANGLFFLFFPLRLDSAITWRYVIVFIPLWVSLCIALLFVISKLILAIVHRCSRRLIPNQRESSTITEAIIYAIMFIPFSIFAILLVDRLDHEDNEQIQKVSFTVISIPLWIALIAWLIFSFGATDSNPWWFGLRRDLCEILLGQCPYITLYFNNKFKFEPRPSTTVPTNDIIIDIPTSNGNKNFGSMNMKKLLTANINNEKNRTIQSNLMSLLEPD
ncbi:unnamed protein product [Rotaria sordida]|uniref:Uncharacterized protein n=2 Tax=Rotaria sordida TaxID=392033 RepID=A0A814MBQ1_9BILA|nr:unnamed protein product [Rotaria sordida]CAF1077418.1 unnamed protein product [Rotaria sordida]CAF1542990.1 unnamed protein product [Rotaria sordida]